MRLVIAAVAAFALAAFTFSPALGDAAPSDSPAATAPSAPAAASCPYCRALRGADEFCSLCGRLAATETTGAANRFWGDVPYVIQFPPADLGLTISADLADTGLTRETVTLRSGDRYTVTPGPQGSEVEGRVSFLRATKESRVEFTIRDTVEGSRLVSREIRGEITGKPDSFLHRKLDYVYAADGRLEIVKFGTWFYNDASDWKKKPGEWSRHAVGEIALVREDGRLTRVETTVREGRRSLRGEPEYADPKVTVEIVKRGASGAVDHLVPTAR